MDKIKYRAVIKFFVKEGLTSNEIHSNLIKLNHLLVRTYATGDVKYMMAINSDRLLVSYIYCKLISRVLGRKECRPIDYFSDCSLNFGRTSLRYWCSYALQR